jgi:hypothetical protein
MESVNHNNVHLQNHRKAIGKLLGAFCMQAHIVSPVLFHGGCFLLFCLGLTRFQPFVYVGFGQDITSKY